jgi:conjugal transfer pilus assembly protein TraD
MGKLGAQLGTLAVQDLVAASGRRLAASADGTAGRQALIGIDEFSALEGEQVMALLARARESGISVLVATQELADLDRAARGLRDQVLGNTALKIAHRQDVPASAQTIAQMAGTETRWEITERLTDSPLSLAFSRGSGQVTRGTRREVEQFLVHPNEIKRLRTGEAVLISKLPSATVRTVRVAPPAQRGAPER